MDNFIYEEGPDHFNAESERQFALGEEAEFWARSKAAHIKNLEAEIAGVRSVIDPLNKRLEALVKRCASTRDSLTSLLAGAGIKKLSDPRFVIRLREYEVTKVADPSSLPEIYIARKVSERADLAAIKRDLRRGVVVPGCTIEKRSLVTVK